MIIFILNFTMPFDYAYPGCGARGLSSASFFTYEDITALWWNPANGSIGKTGIYFDWTYLINNFNLFDLALGYNLGYLEIFLGLNYFTSGEMPINPEIEDTIIPNNNGYFSIKENLLILSLKKKINLFNLGLNLKYYQQQMLGFHGLGFGYDLGLTINQKLKFSIIIKDLRGTKISWFGESIDRIPQSTVLAISFPYNYKDYEFSGEISYIFNGSKNYYLLGSEIKIRKILSIRLGYSDFRKISFGIGLDFFMISMYYTIMNSNFEPTNILGFYIKTGGKK